MADQNVNGLPLATLPLLGTDKIVVTRDGVNLNQATVADLPIGGGSVAGVESFAGRTGAVNPQAEDYSSFYATEASALAAANNAVSAHVAQANPHDQYLEGVNVSDEGVARGAVSAINFVGEGVTATVTGGMATVTIPGGGGSGVAGVSSFNGRSGDVSPQAADYDVFFVNPVELTSQPRTYTAAQVVGQVAVPFAATLNIDASTGNAFNIAALTGNTTLAAPTNLVAGGTYLFIFRQDATGGRMVTFNPVFRFLSGVAQIDQTANAISMVGAYYDGTNLITNIVKENV